MVITVDVSPRFLWRETRVFASTGPVSRDPPGCEAHSGHRGGGGQGGPVDGAAWELGALENPAPHVGRPPARCTPLSFRIALQTTGPSQDHR